MKMWFHSWNMIWTDSGTTVRKMDTINFHLLHFNELQAKTKNYGWVSCFDSKAAFECPKEVKRRQNDQMFHNINHNRFCMIRRKQMQRVEIWLAIDCFGPYLCLQTWSARFSIEHWCSFATFAVQTLRVVINLQQIALHEQHLQLIRSV